MVTSAQRSQSQGPCEALRNEKKASVTEVWQKGSETDMECSQEIRKGQTT